MRIARAFAETIRTKKAEREDSCGGKEIAPPGNEDKEHALKAHIEAGSVAMLSIVSEINSQFYRLFL